MEAEFVTQHRARQSEIYRGSMHELVVFAIVADVRSLIRTGA